MVKVDNSIGVNNLLQSLFSLPDMLKTAILSPPAFPIHGNCERIAAFFSSSRMVHQEASPESLGQTL